MAAVRRLSFARGAEELNVTPAAISHQVKSLEEWLGTHAYQMATDGHGVVLAKNALIAEALRGGRLVTPFDLNIPSELRYELVYSEPLANNRKVVDFRDWLADEARRDDHLHVA